MGRTYNGLMYVFIIIYKESINEYGDMFYMAMCINVKKSEKFMERMENHAC